MPDEVEQPSPAHRHTALWSAMAWLRDLLLSVVLAIVLILFLYQPVKVEGTSMMPALEDQDRIFINNFVYRFGLGEIERLDTVVFRFPRDPSKSYIKRVIGLPGDSVEVRNGKVFLNGREMDESYVPREFRDGLTLGRVLVPEESYFVMGDHRSSSNDSRSWGPVHRRYIYGKAVFSYWPPTRVGIVR
jgi:signal peptidase I